MTVNAFREKSQGSPSPSFVFVLFFFFFFSFFFLFVVVFNARQLITATFSSEIYADELHSWDKSSLSFFLPVWPQRDCGVLLLLLLFLLLRSKVIGHDGENLGGHSAAKPRAGCPRPPLLIQPPLVLPFSRLQRFVTVAFLLTAPVSSRVFFLLDAGQNVLSIHRRHPTTTTTSLVSSFPLSCAAAAQLMKR